MKEIKWKDDWSPYKPQEVIADIHFFDLYAREARPTGTIIGQIYKHEGSDWLELRIYDRSKLDSVMGMAAIRPLRPEATKLLGERRLKLTEPRG